MAEKNPLFLGKRQKKVIFFCRFPEKNTFFAVHTCSIVVDGQHGGLKIRRLNMVRERKKKRSTDQDKRCVCIG